MTTIHGRARRAFFVLVAIAAACSSDVKQPPPTDDEHDDEDDDGTGGANEIGDCSSVAQGGEMTCACAWPASPRRDIRCSLGPGETHAICNCSIDGELIDTCDFEAGSFDCTVSPGLDYGCCEGAFE